MNTNASDLTILYMFKETLQLFEMVPNMGLRLQPLKETKMLKQWNKKPQYRKKFCISKGLESEGRAEDTWSRGRSVLEVRWTTEPWDPVQRRAHILNLVMLCNLNTTGHLKFSSTLNLTQWYCSMIEISKYKLQKWILESIPVGCVPPAYRTCFSSHLMSAPVGGGSSSLNKFEQVSGLGH